jgi:hypothetical protein
MAGPSVLQSASNKSLNLIRVIADRFDHFLGAAEAARYPWSNVDRVVSWIHPFVPKPFVGIPTLLPGFVEPANHGHRFGAVECQSPAPRWSR